MDSKGTKCHPHPSVSQLAVWLQRNGNDWRSLHNLESGLFTHLANNSRVSLPGFSHCRSNVLNVPQFLITFGKSFENFPILSNKLHYSVWFQWNTMKFGILKWRKCWTFEIEREWHSGSPVFAQRGEAVNLWKTLVSVTHVEPPAAQTASHYSY